MDSAGNGRLSAGAVRKPNTERNPNGDISEREEGADNYRGNIETVPDESCPTGDHAT